jgi:hypothetical protein
MADRNVNRRRFVMGALLLGLVVVAVAAFSLQAGAAGEQVFPLEQVSVFDLPEQAGRQFLVGQRIVCTDKADPNVSRYPPFTSSQPLYGAADFADPQGRQDAGQVYYFALDESGGTDRGYDRLHFDLNHDRDLTNDPPLAVRKSQPSTAILAYSDAKQQTCFEDLAIPFACGAGATRPIEMMPRLVISNSGYKGLSLVTTGARRGRIDFAGQECDVLLGHCYVVTGWFDQPWTALHLIPPGNSRPWDWWGGDRLNAMHKVDGQFYVFSATPTGDKLTVRPYAGPLGTFEVGAGGRNIDRLAIRGSLRSKTTAAAIGEIVDGTRPESVRSCRLPIGDYLPEMVSLDYGSLFINLSNNYHSDGKPRDMKSSRWVYGIAIRQDRPFVLDFSNKPAVLFASPARDYRIKVGEELLVKAVLIDPVLDIMIRDLDIGGDRSASLDPKVTISRSNGEIVAEGVMPFG